ncbi:hypothetical protein V8G54_030661, partial [Vigna mungo]
LHFVHHKRAIHTYKPVKKKKKKTAQNISILPHNCTDQRQPITVMLKSRNILRSGPCDHNLYVKRDNPSYNIEPVTPDQQAKIQSSLIVYNLFLLCSCPTILDR